MVALPVSESGAETVDDSFMPFFSESLSMVVIRPDDPSVNRERGERMIVAEGSGIRDRPASD